MPAWLPGLAASATSRPSHRCAFLPGCLSWRASGCQSTCWSHRSAPCRHAVAACASPPSFRAVHQPAGAHSWKGQTYMQAAGEISEAIQQQLQAHATRKWQMPAAGPVHAVASVPRFAWAASPQLPSDSQCAPSVEQAGPLLQPQPAGQAEGCLLDGWERQQQPAQPHLGQQGMQASAAGAGHNLPPSSRPWQNPRAQAVSGAQRCVQPDQCPPAEMPHPEPQVRRLPQLPWPDGLGAPAVAWPAALPPQAPRLRGLEAPLPSQAAGEWHLHQPQQGQGSPGVGPGGSYPWLIAQQQQRGAQPGMKGAVPQLAGVPASADDQSAWLQPGLTGVQALQQAGASGALELEPEGAQPPGSERRHLIRERSQVAGLCGPNRAPTGARLHVPRQACSSNGQASG